MTTTDAPLAAEVRWDLDPLLRGRTVEDLLDDADARAERLAGFRGQVSSFDAGALAAVMRDLAELQEVLLRAQSYAHLWFVTDTADPSRGALMQKVDERATGVTTKLLFFELE